MNSIVKLNLLFTSPKVSNTGTMTDLEQEQVVGNVINYEKTGLDVACGLDTWQVSTNGVQVCMNNPQNVLLKSSSVMTDQRRKKSDDVQNVYNCNILKSATTSYKDDTRSTMMDKCIDASETPCRHNIVNAHLPCRGFTLGSVEFRSSKYDSCRTMLFGGRRVAICKSCKNTI